MKTIIIDSDQRKTYCQTLIKEMKADGSETVIFKKTDKSSNAAQRRLQWMWNTEVADSGLGRDDDKNDVHIRAKWMFCRPILLRDDDVYPIIHKAFIKAVESSETRSEQIKAFTERYISTEQLTMKQRAEYLTDFQRYWIGQGVNLTDPSLIGLDLNKYREAKK